MCIGVALVVRVVPNIMKIYSLRRNPGRKPHILNPTPQLNSSTPSPKTQTLNLKPKTNLKAQLLHPKPLTRRPTNYTLKTYPMDDPGTVASAGNDHRLGAQASEGLESRFAQGLGCRVFGGPCTQIRSFQRDIQMSQTRKP